MNCRIPLLVALGAASIITATAGAHPNAPYRTLAWAEKTLIDPRPHGEFDTVAADCRGLAPASRGRFKHFYCIERRKDGERFSLTLHTMYGQPGFDWDFSNLRHIGPGAKRAVRTLGRASASGDFATAIASGTIEKPFRITVVASARPDQLIEVTWTVVCSKTSGTGLGSGSKSGKYSDYSAIDHDLRFPMGNPDSCTASASASLTGSGTVAVRLYALL